jgi:hypothetical protein
MRERRPSPIHMRRRRHRSEERRPSPIHRHKKSSNQKLFPRVPESGAINRPANMIGTG